MMTFCYRASVIPCYCNETEDLLVIITIRDRTRVCRFTSLSPSSMHTKTLQALSLLILAPLAVDGSVLLFSQFSMADGIAIEQDYGDRVTAEFMPSGIYGSNGGYTPNVTVSYLGMPKLWSTGYGDLSTILYEDEDVTGILQVVLTADPGYSVTLQSMDIAGYSASLAGFYAAGVAPINGISVYDETDSIVYSSSSPQMVSHWTHTAIDFGGISGQSLRIVVDAVNLGSFNDEIGIDNVVFSQVPEPATYAALAGLVSLALAGLRRRQHRRQV